MGAPPDKLGDEDKTPLCSNRVLILDWKEQIKAWRSLETFCLQNQINHLKRSKNLNERQMGQKLTKFQFYTSFCTVASL